jgi:nucleotide-binding universal stress UspA family protein
MKTLLVPTDFSPASINAVHYAADMAKTIGASLLLVNVYQVPLTYSDVAVVNLSVDALKQASEGRLEELRTALKHVAGSEIKVYTEARLGDTVDELETLCKAIEPFAVVMGSKGASDLQKLLMGSTTLTAIRHLKSPVIIVPPGTVYHGVGKIGLACDFKNVAEVTPVHLIKALVNEFHAELHILNINEEIRKITGEAEEQSAYLETLLGELKPIYHFVNGQHVEDEINRFAELNNLDMLVVIPKKHRLLEGLFHESVSREVVSHAHIPILAIHE